MATVLHGLYTLLPSLLPAGSANLSALVNLAVLAVSMVLARLQMLRVFRAYNDRLFDFDKSTSALSMEQGQEMKQGEEKGRNPHPPPFDAPMWLRGMVVALCLSTAVAGGLYLVYAYPYWDTQA